MSVVRDRLDLSGSGKPYDRRVAPDADNLVSHVRVQIDDTPPLTERLKLSKAQTGFGF